MGTPGRLLLCIVALSSPLSASADEMRERERQTLERALLLAGPRLARLPIALVSERPDRASPNAEAWTSRDASGVSRHVVVSTQSETFRCANKWRPSYQCVLKLASILTHEAWHFHKGANEARAYEAQLGFLVFHGASPEMVSGVTLARDRVLAAEHDARSAAWRRYRERELPAIDGPAVRR